MANTLLAMKLALLVLLLALGSSCQTFRFGWRSLTQKERDYDELEANRAQQETVPDSERLAFPSTWSDFRGPGRAGEYREAPIDLEWRDGVLPLEWKQPVGAGYGSFTVARGLVFSLEQRRDQEALVAYDLATGTEVWKYAWQARYSDALSGPGPRSTPVFDTETARVFALGAEGELSCVRARDGSLVWRANVLELSGSSNLGFGLAASPLIDGERLIVATGDPDEGGHSLLALGKDDGTLLWKALEDSASYASPILARFAGTEWIVILTSERLVGLDRDGRLRWEYPWKVGRGSNCSQPIVLPGDRLFVSSGYGKGSAVVRIMDEGGDVELEEIWSSRRFRTRFNTGVHHRGYVYGLDEGILSCVDVATGRRMWKDGRYGYGQLLIAGDHLVVLDGDGGLRLVRADPEGLAEEAAFQAFENLTMNIPALAHGRLLVRNKVEMACYRIGAPGVTP